MADRFTLVVNDTYSNNDQYVVELNLYYTGDNSYDIFDKEAYISLFNRIQTILVSKIPAYPNNLFLGSAVISVTKKDTARTLTAKGSGNFTSTQNTLDVNIPALQEYQIRYDANGGRGAPATVFARAGETITLSSTSPTRTGYNFVGWTTSTADIPSHSPGGSYIVPAQDTTFRAVWEKPTYVITFHSEETEDYTSKVKLGETFTFLAPYAPGKVFSRWRSEHGSYYSAGQKVTWTSGMDTVYYAEWGEIPSSYPPRILRVSAIRDDVYPSSVRFSMTFSFSTETVTAAFWTREFNTSTWIQGTAWKNISDTTVSNIAYNFDTNKNYEVRWGVNDGVSGWVYTYDIISSNNYIWKTDGTKLEVGVPLYVEGRKI